MSVYLKVKNKIGTTRTLIKCMGFLCLFTLLLFCSTVSAYTYTGAISSISISPSTIHAGDDITHSITVRNTGTASLPINVMLYTSGDYSDQTYLENIVPVGQTKTIPLYSTVPNVDSGQITFTYQLYWDRAFPDSDLLLDTETRSVSISQSAPPPGYLYVTFPSGASIYIDGVFQQNTPTTLPPGTYTVRVSLTGYNDYSTTATIYAGQTTTVSATLIQAYTPPTTGSVTIVASGDQSYYVGETFTFSGTCTQGNSVLLVLTGGGLPSSGVTLATDRQVLADNTWSYQWTVPSSIGGYTISSGTYTAYAYDSSRQAYGTVSINLKTQTSPEPTTGFLSITSSPSEANIYIDGVLLGTTPATSPRSFSTGSHTIILRKTGYNDYSTTATVYAGQTTTVYGYLSQIPESQPYVAQPLYEYVPPVVAQPAVAQPAYVQPVSQSNSGSSDPSGFILLLFFWGVVAFGGYILYKKMRRSDKTEPPLHPSTEIQKGVDTLVLQSSSQSTQPATPAKTSPDDDVIKVVKMRYAKGEISTEEYQKMLDHLKK